MIGDSWYASRGVIEKSIQNGFTGLFALKSNRKVEMDTQFVSVEKIDENIEFYSVTVKGNEFRCFTMVPPIFNSLFPF